MSRSGYCEDYDTEADINLYRGSVERAMRGKRGQAFFVSLLAAMDAMPVKELIADELETPTGAVCAIGALGKARGIDMTRLDPEDPRGVGETFDIAESLAREVVYMNDESGISRLVERCCATCHGWGEIAGIDHPSRLSHWGGRFGGDRPVKCSTCHGRGRLGRYFKETPAERWTRMHAWIASNIAPPTRSTTHE